MKNKNLSKYTIEDKQLLADYSRLNNQSKLFFEIMSFSFIGLRSKKNNGIEITKARQEKIVNGKRIRSTVYTITVAAEEGD